MSLTAEQYNNKYSEELDKTFNKLEGYEDIEERLEYYDTEKQITDDLVKIKETVLDIYSSDEKVDWILIKPLKIKLSQLQKNLDYFQLSLDNKQKVNTSTINNTRLLIKEIGNLKTSSGMILNQQYKKSGLSEMKNETFNLINSQVNKLSNIVDNIWNSDDKISDLEKESTELIKEFCIECDLYIQKNQNIFNSLTTQEDRLDFVIDGFSEVIENVIGPSKFKILLGKKFDILDTIEEYSVTLYDLINEYGLKDKIIGYFKNYFN